MFDGLFKLRFYTKCKSLIKLVKIRLERVRRKKNAVCKYLKNDVADLLMNGLAYNAYGRTEGLLDEKKRLSCYDFIEGFCECVASNLSLMQKSWECPEECREAISSLIYAAARISEVPELRDLRSLFTEKYRNDLKPFVSLEFVEKFKTNPPSKEMKLQLMHDVAHEFSIQWDFTALEQRLYNPPQTERSEPSHGSTNNIDDGGDKMYGHKNDAFVNKNKRDPRNFNDFEKKDRINLKFHGRKAFIDDENKLSYINSKDESIDAIESSERDSLGASSSSTGSISEDEPESVKPFYYRIIPAPYTKPRAVQVESVLEEKTKQNPSAGNISKEDKNLDQENGLLFDSKQKPRSVRRRFARPPPNAIQDERINPNERKQENTRNNFRFPPMIDERDQDTLYPLKPPPSRQAKSHKPLEFYSIDEADVMNDIPSGEGAIRHVRTSSWQRETLRNHPKLPDYDELKARVAALRRK